MDLPSKLLICEALDDPPELLSNRSPSRVFHDSLIPEIKPIVVMGDVNENFVKNKVCT